MAGIDDWERDPELTDDDDPGYREELFEMCIHFGWPPSDLLDRPFAAQFKEWLARQQPARTSTLIANG
jgi:hypothetical protein